MSIKPYWILVAGFVVILLFVIVIRMPSGRHSRHRWHPSHASSTWLGPGGTRHLLGFGAEGFSSGATFTMLGVDWCPHCVKAKPIFESLGPTVTIGGEAVALRYINPETDKESAKGYQVDGYPTFYFEKDGKKVKHTGPRSADGFHEFLKTQLSL
jgi:thiol-disulfide isomerase/thioredoxin